MITIHRKWDMKPVVEISNVCINVAKKGKIKDVPITVHGHHETEKVIFCTVLRKKYPLHLKNDFIANIIVLCSNIAVRIVIVLVKMSKYNCLFSLITK